MQYIPLKWALKLLFETSGVIQMMREYINLLTSDTSAITNFMQANLWKNYKFSNDKVYVPIFIYYDDFEAGNALGLHAGTNKLGGIYASLPCFPTSFSSQLDNILLIALFYADDRKYFGNKRIFSKLIEELNELKREGLVVNVNNQTLRIYFQLNLIIGDNLAMNEMLGFVESFAFGRPCRICNLPIDRMKSETKEIVRSLRTRDSYNEDLKLNCPSGYKGRVHI